jgi:hypothetical protein
MKTDGISMYDIATKVFRAKIDFSGLYELQGTKIKSVSRITVVIMQNVKIRIKGVSLKMPISQKK